MFIARRVVPATLALAVLAFPSACRDAVEPEVARFPGDAALAKGGIPGAGGGGKPTFKILFESWRTAPFDFEIYSMNSDGSGVTPLTSSDFGSNSNLSMSADGTRIAFASTRDGNSEIYVANSDGTGAVNITNHDAFDGFPQLSPDGFRIVFVSDRSGVNALYVMNAEPGSTPREVSNTIGGYSWSKWAPVGNRFAFGDTRGGLMSDLAVSNAAGTIVQYLSNTPDFAEIDPDWSPDGSKIAFSSDRTGEGEIYVINADGTGEQRLTFTTPTPVPAVPTSERNPVWSPDGSRIAFRSARDGGNLDIWVMNANGSGQTRLTTATAIEDEPVWSPDGKQIAFLRFLGAGEFDIYTMSANGKNQRNITLDPGSAVNPIWKR